MADYSKLGRMSPDHDPEPDESDVQPEDVSAWNLAIIEALADGVHPMTAEDLEEADIFREPKVRRALAAARDALAKEIRRNARRATLPKQAGRPWSADEDATLVERFEGGTSFAELAKQHGRTDGAIRSRLTKVGKLLPEH